MSSRKKTNTTVKELCIREIKEYNKYAKNSNNNIIIQKLSEQIKIRQVLDKVYRRKKLNEADLHIIKEFNEKISDADHFYSPTFFTHEKEKLVKIYKRMKKSSVIENMVPQEDIYINRTKMIELVKQIKESNDDYLPLLNELKMRTLLNRIYYNKPLSDNDINKANTFVVNINECRDECKEVNEIGNPKNYSQKEIDTITNKYYSVKSQLTDKNKTRIKQ